MRPDEFQTAVQTANEIGQRLLHAFGPEQREAIRTALERLSAIVGEEAMPFVQVQVGFLDRQRQQSIVLRRIDVSFCNDRRLFVTGHEPTQRTFFKDGEFLTVPEDCCPNCLGDWKINPRDLAPCPHCGIQLGKRLRIAAGDSCPFCEEDWSASSAAICICGLDRNASFVIPVPKPLSSRE